MTTITKNKQYKGRPDGSFEETINETIIDNNDGRVFELEKQLHEQYAVNNNSNAGTLASLMSALFIAISGYGYVLYQYSLCSSYKISILYIAAFCASVIMALLYCICIHLGAGQRMEQFITFAIRIKHYGLKKSENIDKEGLEWMQSVKRYEDIYPKDYHPFNKRFDNFVQGIYGLLSRAFIVAIYTIGLSLCIIKEGIIYIPIFLCYVLLLHSLLVVYKLRKYIKYKNRETEMKILEYKELSKNDENTSKYELHIKPNWVIIVVIAILMLCTIAAGILSNMDVIFIINKK